VAVAQLSGGQLCLFAKPTDRQQFAHGASLQLGAMSESRGPPNTVRGQPREAKFQPPRRRARETSCGPPSDRPTRHSPGRDRDGGRHAVEGIRLADQVDLSQTSVVERRCRHYMKVAKMLRPQAEDMGTLTHLRLAWDTAPEHVQHDPLVREMVRGLLHRARPTYAPEVRSLANKMGLGYDVANRRTARKSSRGLSSFRRPRCSGRPSLRSSRRRPRSR
jgi:hypothetical protein